MYWRNDYMVVEFSSTKCNDSNEEGERREVRLLYVNADNPCICPVLAAAVYLASSSRQDASPSDSLFLGSDSQAKKFNKHYFIVALEDMKEFLKNSCHPPPKSLPCPKQTEDIKISQ